MEVICTNKKCVKCNEEKELICFAMQPSCKMGVANMCKICKKAYDKIRTVITKEERSIKNKIYRQNNIEKIRLRQQKTYQKFKTAWRERRNDYKKRYSKEKIKTSILYKIKILLRNRLGAAIRWNQKSQKTLELLGCTVENLKVYLESKFLTGMSWENHGLYGWHIDHIRPCASFNLIDPEQQRKCFHYSNLQPLWASDNFKKSDKYTPPNPESNPAEALPQKTEILQPEPQKNTPL